MTLLEAWLIQAPRLAAWAVVAAALGNPNLADDGAAALAGLAVPTVDIEMILRIAFGAVRFEIPADAGAFMPDAVSQ